MRSVVAHWALAILPLFGACAARNGANLPQDVVRKYCAAHLLGAGLSSATYPEIAALVAWPEEPGWDTATVVSSYTISTTAEVESKASVDVSYAVLGSLIGGKWTPRHPGEQASQETVTYELVRYGSVWKITGPLKEPHIGLGAAIESLESMRKQAAEPAIQTSEELEESLLKLKAIRANL